MGARRKLQQECGRNLRVFQVLRQEELRTATPAKTSKARRRRKERETQATSHFRKVKLNMYKFA